MRSRVVPEVGVEPTRGRPRRILSPLRLPFRHSGPAVPPCWVTHGIYAFPQPKETFTMAADPNEVFSSRVFRGSWA
jgi:hypothetical protein